MKYFIVVGEASGDLHASDLMASLMQRDAEAEFAYMGGSKMRALGGTCVVRSEDMAFMGFLDVVRNYSTIRKNALKVQDFLLTYRPDVVICVDYAGFCFKYILPFVKEQLPHAFVTYYIPPKVWAWKKRRIGMLKSHTDLVLTIFPFEVPFFRQEALDHARYVGNPSLEQIKGFEHTLPPTPSDKPYIALLCGSRISEIRKNLPTMLEVCAEYPEYEVIIAGAPGVDESIYTPIIASTPHVKLLFGQTYTILSHARAALVTSGTATLETALLGIPQVVCYAVTGGGLANFVFRHFFSIPYISLVNLIAGHEVVREMYGGLFSPPYISSEFKPLLGNTPQRGLMTEEYRRVRGLLETPNPAAATAADCILDNYKNKKMKPS